MTHVGARARMPSTMMWMPGRRPRHLPDDARRCRSRCSSSGSGSSASSSCSARNSMRSPASARFTASTDTGRLTASGCTLSGNATVPRSGSTGSSGGRGGVVDGDSAMTVLPRISSELRESRQRVAAVAVDLHRGVCRPGTGDMRGCLTPLSARTAGPRARRPSASDILRAWDCRNATSSPRNPRCGPRTTRARGAAAATTTRCAGYAARRRTDPVRRRRAGSRDVRQAEGLSRFASTTP